ncbi:MAG: DUF262 domain-containing protein [Terriglobia bacterium]
MAETTTPKSESQDLSVGALFKDFYSVPDFQPEYVWQREQVERLLQDLYDEFYDEEGRILSGPEYFLGSIVSTERGKGVYCEVRHRQSDKSVASGLVRSEHLWSIRYSPLLRRESCRYRAFQDSEHARSLMSTINIFNHFLTSSL